MGHDVLDEPAPRLTTESVRRVVSQNWDLAAGDVRLLSSERDLNVLVDDHVLKVSNPAESRPLVEMEVAAMAHVSAVDPSLPIPLTVSCIDLNSIAEITDDTGRPCLARLITTVPGSALEGQPITEALAEQVGTATARMQAALGGFFHPAAGSRDLDWDVRRLPAVAGRAGLGDDDPLRAVVDRVSASLGRLAALPSGVHHADVTLTNLLATDGRITGVIDFGDLHYTADVADLAVALTSVVRNTSEVQVSSLWELAGATLRGYQRLRPLSHAEVDVLGELVLSRLVLSTLISRARAAAHPDNTAYITQYDDANARTTTQLAQLPPAELAERLHRLAERRSG